MTRQRKPEEVHSTVHSYRCNLIRNLQIQAASHDVTRKYTILCKLDGAANRGHKQTDIIVMDFAKAFDPHRRLLNKLDCYGL